jgi:hypothetical protein
MTMQDDEGHTRIESTVRYLDIESTMLLPYRNRLRFDATGQSGSALPVML